MRDHPGPDILPADITSADGSSGKIKKPHQCGAICWKIDDRGWLMALLITSKRTGRWIIPKGNIKRRENQFECARREAFEEAGVTGRIAKKTIGQYRYFKPERQQWLTVSVYPLLVSEVADAFPEMNVRKRRWLPVEKASTCCDEPDLRALFQSFAALTAGKVTSPVDFSGASPG
jgi:8-oxo-dGTP pyrophosphatase MutT (NUDIX family)